MDRDSVNKVIKMIRATYPNSYRTFGRPEFVELANSMEKAFSKFPNLVVEVEYERWCHEKNYPPTISDIIPKVFATLPSDVNNLNDPHKWQSYIDENDRYVVVPPQGSRCYEEVNR